MISDGGAWLRKNMLVMSRMNNSPIGDWLDMPLLEFAEWIEANNEISKMIKSEK